MNVFSEIELWHIARSGNHLGGATESNETKSLQAKSWRADTLPTWTNELLNLCNFISGNIEMVKPQKDRLAEQPFDSILQLIATYVYEDIERSHDPEIVSQLNDDILDLVKSKLSEIISKPIFIEYKFCLDDKSESDKHCPGDNIYYTSFICDLLYDGMKSYFLRNPMLARSVTIIVTTLKDEIANLIGRLKYDFEVLSKEWGGGRKQKPVKLDFFGPAKSFEPRQYKLDTEDYVLVYDTEGIDGGQLFNRVVKLYNEDTGDDLYTPSRIDREEYSWIVYPKDRPKELNSTFFRQFGILSGLSYGLNVRDIPPSYIARVNQNPFLIDIRESIYPTVAPTGRNDQTPISRGLDNSVFSTGLFPIQQSIKGCPIRLGGHLTDELPSFKKSFTNKNTDAMELEYVSADVESMETNLPTVEQSILDDNILDVISGFRDAYRFLENNKATLLQYIDTSAKGCKFLYYHRAKSEYMKIISRYNVPSNLASISDAESMIKEELQSSVGQNPRADIIQKVEISALTNQIFPSIIIKGCDNTICGDVFFENTAVESMRNTLASLNCNDLNNQLARIKWALGCVSETSLVELNINNNRMKVFPTDRGLSRQLIISGRREPALTEFVTEVTKSGYTIIDVGANIGYFTLIEAGQAAPGGKVYAFEPQADNVSVLKDNCSINEHHNVVIEQLALSNETGTKKMIQTTRSNLHTLHGIENGAESEAFSNSIAENEEGVVEVPATTLDKYIDDNDLNDIDLIRIDVQGHELATIEGMESTLAKMDKGSYFIFECHIEFFDKPRDIVPQILDILYSAGFSFYGLVDAKNRWWKNIDEENAKEQILDCTTNVHVVFNK